MPNHTVGYQGNCSPTTEWESHKKSTLCANQHLQAIHPRKCLNQHVPANAHLPGLKFLDVHAHIGNAS